MRNKIIIATIFLALSACVSLQFDPLEFDRFVTLKETAQEGVLLCGKPEVSLYVHKMAATMRHQNLYASARTTRNDIRVATQNLMNIIEGMDKKYENPTPPSITYCQEKFDNISNGASIIMSEIGKL